MADSRLLLHALKNLLKERNFTYSTVADQLAISETTIKRLFTGKIPLTLDRLDQICTILGTDVFELAKMTERSQSSEPHLTLEQETAIASDLALYVIFYSLIKGFTFPDLLTKFTFDELTAQRKLLELDKLGLIELREENKFKILVPKHIEWLENGPLEKMYEEQMRIDFLNSAFDRPSELLKRVAGPLSDQSIRYIYEKLNQLMAEVKELTLVDNVSYSSSVKPIYTLLIGFREWVPSFIFRYLRKPPSVKQAS